LSGLRGTPSIRIVHCPAPGAARARNAGAAAAGGSVLVFVDADTRIPPLGLRRIEQHVEGGYDSGIFRLAPQSPGLRAWCWWTFWNQVRRLPLSRAKALPAFMFCTRAVFDRFGPFDESVAIGEEWPILAGRYRDDPRRLVYDRTMAARTSGRRMDLQPFGYTRTYLKYALAILAPPARVRYSDAIREHAPASS
jgi:glycosyltransferase involved in cell wall biosynthesis